MQLEVEVKAYAVDLAEIINKLEAGGAKFISDQLEIDDYYSHPSRDFGQTDEALRLRTVQTLSECCGELVEFTYKGPKIDSGSKTREEYSINLKDIHSMSKILEKLDFKLIMTVEKSRKVYNHLGFTICLDDIAGLGTFVEIEKIIHSEDEMENVISEMKSILVEKFGLERFERRSYLELLMDNPRENAQGKA